MPNLIALDANSHQGASGAALWSIDQEGQAWVSGIHTATAVRTGTDENGRENNIQARFSNGNQPWEYLAKGIATAQFYDRAMSFMSQSCDSPEPTLPNQGK